MNAAEFSKRRARIEREAGRRSHQFAGKAMAHLVREAGAVVIVVRGQVVGWRMMDGGVVCVKRRFKDEVDAGLVLVAIQREDLRRRTPVRMYRCQHCGGWHLTSQARGDGATKDHAA